MLAILMIQSSQNIINKKKKRKIDMIINFIKIVEWGCPMKMINIPHNNVIEDQTQHIVVGAMFTKITQTMRGQRHPIRNVSTIIYLLEDKERGITRNQYLGEEEEDEIVQKSKHQRAGTVQYSKKDNSPYHQKGGVINENQKSSGLSTRGQKGGYQNKYGPQSSNRMCNTAETPLNFRQLAPKTFKDLMNRDTKLSQRSHKKSSIMS